MQNDALKNEKNWKDWNMNNLEPMIEKARQLISDCDAVLVTAGAGMGVDSGLPDFRGNEGFWQATVNKEHGIWSAEDIEIAVDMESFKAEASFPLCPTCGANILMFGDWDWISDHSDKQMKRFDRWKRDSVKEKKKIAAIEIGAGTAIASSRRMSENAVKQFHTPLIRINPKEYQGLYGTIKLPFEGLKGIRQIVSIK